MVAVEYSLAWLLQPLAVDAFLDEIWATTHWYVKRGRADYFDELLHGSSAVEELLQAFRSEPSAVRLLRGEEKKPPDSYRLPDGTADLARVREDFADGYTIVLDRVEQRVRAVGSLSHSIEVELNFAAQVNAYITPAESQGFLPHYDEHDALILQVQGAKIWHLYEGADVPPHQMRHRQPVAADDLPMPTDLRLEVGDVLYLPRGLVHAAEATSEPSTHLTVGIHAPTVRTLITRALDRLTFRDDRVHTRLPPRHLDDANARADVDALVGEVVRMLEDPSAIAEGLSALEDVLVRRGRCPPVGQASANTADIDGETFVVKYQPLYSRVTADASSAVLHFAQLSMRADSDHTAALRFISGSSQPFRVGDLPELALAQQIDVARTLLVSGYLVRLPQTGRTDWSDGAR